MIRIQGDQSDVVAVGGPQGTDACSDDVAQGGDGDGTIGCREAGEGDVLGIGDGDIADVGDGDIGCIHRGNAAEAISGGDVQGGGIHEAVGMGYFPRRSVQGNAVRSGQQSVAGQGDVAAHRAGADADVAS